MERAKSAIFMVSFVSVVLADISRNSEGILRTYLLNRANYYPRDRPVMSSRESVHVTLQLVPYAMLDLNERDQLLTIAFWITVGWRDERLTWDPEDYNNTDLVYMYTDEIWIPSVTLSNSLNTDGSTIGSSPKTVVLVTSEGDVLLGETMVQSTHCPIDVRYFPFDYQECPFDFVAGNQPEEHIIVTSQTASYMHSVKTLEWVIVGMGHRDGYEEIPYYVTNRPLSNLTYTTTCVNLQRYPQYYVYTLIVPSTLLCILSMITFLAPPDCGERISLSVSMVLGLTVFQLLIADTLPTASKEGSLLSSYLNANFILACLVVPLSVTNISIANGDTLILIRVMKSNFLKILCLGSLPRILKVPSFRERIQNEAEELKERNKFLTKNQVDNRKSVTKGKGLTTTVAPFDDSAFRETTSSLEKRKIGAHTLSTVMDRLSFIAFLTVFAIISTVTVCRFAMNPGKMVAMCPEF